MKGKVEDPTPVEETELPEDFIDKVTERLELYKEHKELEAKLEEVNEYLKVMMQANDLEKVKAGPAVVSIVTQIRNTIVAEKLIEQGVDPAVVLKATKSTPVVSMTVKELK